MCGIAGILLRDRDGGEDEDRRVRAALARLRHRGPDDEGVCRSSGAVLGHRRLSILDLSPAGHQPMQTGDGRLFCSLNGEIYNYLELRTELAAKGRAFRTGTDTEVLLAAFAEWGTAAVERFRGQFAVAIWDAAAQRLVLARDRVGEKPLHYWRDGGRVAFASEIKAILELLPSPPSLSPDAIDTYLHYQYVIEPETLLDGVRKLPAGCVLELDAAHWDAPPRRYWSLGAVAPIDGDPVERMRHALDEAVTLTLRSDAPVGVALSGGLDSGVIAAMAAQHRQDLTAFTVGYPGQRDFDERAAARGLAASLRIPWHDVELPTGEFAAFFPRLVELLDEPIADVAAYGHYAVARLAAAHGVKVLLTGIGGDELFFGYGWVRRAVELSRAKLDAARSASAALAVRARLLRAFMRTPLPTLLANHRLPRAWRDFVDRQLDDGRLDLDHPAEWVFYQLDYHWDPAVEFTSRVFAPEFSARLTRRGPYRLMSGLSDALPPEIAVTGMLFDSWLVSNCLDLGDRVSMASSVETRVPLLEAGVIDTAVGLWRAGRREDAQGHKTWLRAIARSLLPAEYIDRPKLGFVTPTVEWTQAVNARYGQLVLDGALSRARVIDPDRLKAWARAARPGIRRDFLLYKLTLLELWCRIVLGRERPEGFVASITQASHS
jgi:asparagine synthase (glutamine-hydrolysing)